MTVFKQGMSMIANKNTYRRWRNTGKYLKLY